MSVSTHTLESATFPCCPARGNNLVKSCYHHSPHRPSRQRRLSPGEPWRTGKRKGRRSFPSEKVHYCGQKGSQWGQNSTSTLVFNFPTNGFKTSVRVLNRSLRCIEQTTCGSRWNPEPTLLVQVKASWLYSASTTGERYLHNFLRANLLRAKLIWNPSFNVSFILVEPFARHCFLYAEPTG